MSENIPVVTRRPRVSLWILRALALIHLLAISTQPVTIGQYLNGVFPALEVHGLVGSLLSPLCLVLGAVGLAYALAGGRIWLVPVLVVLFLAEGFQIGMGYAGNLAIHVPLGVLIITASMLLAIWTWLPDAARGRTSRPKEAAAQADQPVAAELEPQP